jgi:hypothetical protein
LAQKGFSPQLEVDIVLAFKDEYNTGRYQLPIWYLSFVGKINYIQLLG